MSSFICLSVRALIDTLFVIWLGLLSHSLLHYSISVASESFNNTTHFNTTSIVVHSATTHSRCFACVCSSACNSLRHSRRLEVLALSHSQFWRCLKIFCLLVQALIRVDCTADSEWCCTNVRLQLQMCFLFIHWYSLIYFTYYYACKVSK